MSKESITVFMGMMRQIQISTDNFKADLQVLDYEQLLALPLVSTELLNTAETAIKAVHPKDHVSLRRAIVYVTELQARQAEALEELTAAIQAENEWISSQLNKTENGQRTTHNV